MNSKTKFFTRKRMILLATAVILLILAMFAFDTRLLVQNYTIEAEEIETEETVIVDDGDEEQAPADEE